MLRRLLRALESLFGDDRFAIHIIASEKILDIEVGLCFCHFFFGLNFSGSQQVDRGIDHTPLQMCAKLQTKRDERFRACSDTRSGCWCAYLVGRRHSSVVVRRMMVRLVAWDRGLSLCPQVPRTQACWCQQPSFCERVVGFARRVLTHRLCCSQSVRQAAFEHEKTLVSRSQ